MHSDSEDKAQRTVEWLASRGGRNPNSMANCAFCFVPRPLQVDVVAEAAITHALQRFDTDVFCVVSTMEQRDALTAAVSARLTGGDHLRMAAHRSCVLLSDVNELGCGNGKYDPGLKRRTTLFFICSDSDADGHRFNKHVASFFMTHAYATTVCVTSLWFDRASWIAHMLSYKRALLLEEEGGDARLFHTIQ